MAVFDKKTRSGIVLYFADLRAVLEHFSDAQIKALMTAIVDYAQYGIEPQLDDKAQIGFELMRVSIDNDGKKYTYKRLHNKYKEYCRECEKRYEAVSLSEEQFFEYMLAAENPTPLDKKTTV